MKVQYSKIRVGLLAMAFAMMFALFLARLVFVQVVKGDEYRERAQRQYLQSIELPAERGEIYDIKGNKIAVNAPLYSLFVYALNDAQVDSAYRQLARIFATSQSGIRRAHRLRPGEFAWIKRGLSAQDLARFESGSKGCGLFLREEPNRKYPYGAIGRGILGFVDLDNRGGSGIELMMQDYLVGTSGRSYIQKNAMGTEYRVQEVPVKEAVPGMSVVLTIDWDKQQIVEEELARAVKKHHAKAGMAVFIDPYTGAVLAAADYSPGQESCDKPMKLNAVAETFEPGSIFKLITAAAALDDGRVDPSDSFDAEHGCWRLGRNILRDDHEYDTLTFRGGFELSSNIVMGKVANEIGGDNVFSMAKRMGFGRQTRCGLNGESAGILTRHRWSKYVTSTFAIGHGVSVSAMQMAQAFGIVASGGFLAQPHFVAGCINDKGNIVDRHESHPIRVLDDDVVAILDSFLRGVVTQGTGMPIADAPFAIAGKTGTGEKPNLETGGYYKNRFMASFAGYFPADSPLVAGIVILDEPEPVHYGGHTSGPAFRDIAVKFAALDNYGPGQAVAIAAATPTTAAENVAAAVDRICLPDVIGNSRTRAAQQLEALGLAPVFQGDGQRVAVMFPPAESRVETGQRVCCFMSHDWHTELSAPDLTGLSVREAIAVLGCYDVVMVCRGKGRVVKQQPVAGARIARGETVTLICKRDTGV